MNGECYDIAGIQQGVQAGMSPGGAQEVPPLPTVQAGCQKYPHRPGDLLSLIICAGIKD